MDLEKAFEFLAQNRAELSAKIGTITDTLSRLEKSLKENREQVSRHTQHIGVIREAIVALVASDRRLQEKLIATDERISVLITTVERLIDRRNGQSEEL